jgi:formylglycine-generating enzyme required for sulfatase activity
MAFCVWDGGYLPTEAEWNYVASNGAEQRAFPWSSPADSIAFDATDVNVNCLGDGNPACAFTDLLPVGSLPAGAGALGHEDLGGNVSEWVLDVYAAAYQIPCNDCANLAAGAMRSARGGNFFRLIGLARSGFRGSSIPTQNSIDSGVRCARPP